MHVYMCFYVCTYTHTYRIHTYVYIYIYIHTHIHSYIQGGKVKGSSFVGSSPLLPPSCNRTISPFSTKGTGGAVCTGAIFRRMWYVHGHAHTHTHEYIYVYIYIYIYIYTHTHTHMCTSHLVQHTSWRIHVHMHEFSLLSAQE